MSDLIELELERVQEEFFERGWTDGLPVLPPTPTAVRAMMSSVDGGPDDVIGSIPRRNRSVTIEQAAINSVMAGCRPDYFPIVVAAVGATLDPAFNAHAAFTSTGGAATCVVVSGPLAHEVGMNAAHNALGAGNRANATIGRAVRLVARNIFGASTGDMDATSMGNPGKYTLCFAEQDPPAPWEPLRVQLGYESSDTTVTVMATESPRQIANHLSEVPEDVLRTFVSSIRSPSGFPVGKGGQAFVVMCPEHADAVRVGGWTQLEAREFLARESRVSPEWLTGNGVPLEVASAHDMTPGDDGLLPSLTGADGVFLVTAGGPGPGWSAYIPSFAPAQHIKSVTRRVRTAGEALPDCGPDACRIDLSAMSGLAGASS